MSSLNTETHSRIPESEHFSDVDVILPAKSLDDIQKAISHGLSCLSEVLRLREIVDYEESMGNKVPCDFLPVIPAQSAHESMEPFANALLWLNDVTLLKRRGNRQ